MKKVNISCFVVFHNEYDLVLPCLESVSFCNEIVLLNISGEERINQLLTGKDITIYQEKKEEIVELIRKGRIERSTYDWVLLIDPDERIDETLSAQIIQLFENNPDKYAGIQVPWQFYFASKKLNGTFWGQKGSSKLILYDKNKMSYSDKLHINHQVMDQSFSILNIEKNGRNVLHHYWSNNFDELYQKHRRYLAHEGKHKYEMGKRYNRSVQIKSFFSSFYDSYFIYKGWKDGWIGMRLSIFYAWYNYHVMESIKRYQQQLGMK